MFTSLFQRLVGHTMGTRAIRRKPSFVPRLEGLGDRIVPASFAFDASAHALVVTTDTSARVAARDQSDRVDIVHDGVGGVTVTVNGDARVFTGIESLTVNSGEGADAVTYRQGKPPADLKASKFLPSTKIVPASDVLGGNGRFVLTPVGDREFHPLHVNVNLGNGNDSFRADLYGNQNDSLYFRVLGQDGNDEIQFVTAEHFHSTNWNTLRLDFDGGSGDDTIGATVRGVRSGYLNLNIHGGNDQDDIRVLVNLESGSVAMVAGLDTPEPLADLLGTAYPVKEAQVAGDLGDDNLIFAIYQEPGVDGYIYALIDGGYGFGWPDNDTGYHTSNVRSAYLEHDHIL